MKNSIIFTAIILTGAALCTAQQPDKARIVANPMNLSYRFQPLDNAPARREAADPVCEYFQGKYYLFASKSGGYWSSPNLAEWTFIPCRTIETIEAYAPAILVIDNELFFLASGKPARIFKTSDPDKDSWTEIATKFVFPTEVSQDPAFFRDDDGRTYLYWGCSDRTPIYGMEVDPADGFKGIGELKTLITHKSALYGWETAGENNELGKDGWNEGPCILKHAGKYYLQYAAPGTEFRSYADGLYVGDSPLGPFTYVESSPFSFKPGGFIGGAGHGHSFRDKYGNLWHVATMKISQRHMFERRLGLFPLYPVADGFAQQAVLSDYPFLIPDRKQDFSAEECTMGWNMLSYGGEATSSSSAESHPPALAFDEQVETWWAAAGGQPGEWLRTDMGKVMEVHAVQVNFSDHDFNIRAPHPPVVYRYYIESSADGQSWSRIADRTANTADAVHELIVLDSPVDARHLRIVNAAELPGKFSISGLRAFGKGNASMPSPVGSVSAIRNASDRRRYTVEWPRSIGATGYIVRSGISPNALHHAVMVYDDPALYKTGLQYDKQLEAGFFNLNSEYYFSVSAFNENGVAP
ncbi:MAG: family 43 glycosylhydrolase [Tannerellaceae bacterium]|nr:family 43 glycosylhydrolase [Tannerellaceae bacterium]